MIPNVYRYPLDLTGSSRDNYITGENQNIGTSPVRAIAPNAGAFYGGSVEILDLSTLQPVTPQQYAFQFLHDALSIKSGQEVWGVLLITDPTVSSTISLSYQAAGGPDAVPFTTLAQEVAALQLDNRSVSLANISGLPDSFTPVPHMHWVGDTYDWDYVISALEICLNALMLAESATYDTTLIFIDQQDGLYTQTIANYAAQLEQHITNYQNPHQVTLAQVGAYSTAQVNTLIAVETAGRQTADTLVSAAIQSHATCYNNPHDDTADAIGAYSICQTNANLAAVVSALNETLASDNIAMLEHIANDNNPHEVTLVQLDGLTTTQINTAIATALSPASTQLQSDIASMTTHIANQNNPHQTTIGQIGAWDNADINALNTNITGHIANHSNPHADTAAGVGTWTAATATSSIANSYTTLMTNSLNNQASTINGHVTNYNNPHGVTVAQIGGWTLAQWDAYGAAVVSQKSY